MPSAFVATFTLSVELHPESTQPPYEFAESQPPTRTTSFAFTTGISSGITSADGKGRPFSLQISMMTRQCLPRSQRLGERIAFGMAALEVRAECKVAAILEGSSSTFSRYFFMLLLTLRTIQEGSFTSCKPRSLGNESGSYT